MASCSPSDLDSISPASLGALAYLTVVGSLVAFTAYGWLLRVAPLPLIATYAYVNPIVAVMPSAPSCEANRSIRGRWSPAR